MTTDGKTLLIIDDEEDWLSLLEKLLSAEGYCVLTAQNCAGAMDILSRNRPHCIISDVRLGAEDGSMLCCRIKSAPGLSDIPVIMLSGIGEEPANCCCDAFVCKADSASSILAAVKKALSK